ncbi:MAG: TraX family protein [Lactococcus garvieae]
MKKIFYSYDLKIIGIIFMVIDHVNTYLGSYLGLPTWIGFLGRFVAPLFVFMMVEGFHYTRSRKKYFLRLLGGGLLMYAINISFNLLTRSSFEDPYGQFDIFLLLAGHNIFMTLALLFAFIWAIDIMRKNQGTKLKYFSYSLVIVLLLPFILLSEGGPYELVLVLIFYFFRGRWAKISAGIITFSLLLLTWSFVGYFTGSAVGTLYQVLSFSNEFMIITVLPFIYLYNGQRGGSGAQWQRDLFYYFYPAHLLILYILRYALVGVV